MKIVNHMTDGKGIPFKNIKVGECFSHNPDGRGAIYMKIGAHDGGSRLCSLDVSNGGLMHTDDEGSECYPLKTELHILPF